MSENRENQAALPQEQPTKLPAENTFSNLKDKAVLFGWMAGLLLLISVLWIFTSSVQSNNLLRSINSILTSNEDNRRVLKYIRHKPGKADLLGYRYSMLNTTDKMFVFGIFQDGILVPLGAILSEQGKVKEILPLSAHAVQVFESLPKSILQMYINRIEENEGNGG